MRLVNCVCDIKIMHYCTYKEISSNFTWISETSSLTIYHPCYYIQHLSFLLLSLLFFSHLFLLPSPTPMSFLLFNDYQLLVGEAVLCTH